MIGLLRSRSRVGVLEGLCGRQRNGASRRVLSRVVEPFLYWLDNIGNIITLTLNTVLWLLRPPFRVAQF